MDKRREYIIKKSLAIFLLILLFIPVSQQYLHIFKEKPLKGAYEIYKNTKFIWNSWLEGDYQEKQERHLNQHFGFRPFFVRLYNQTQYSLFNDTKSKVKGKNNMWYEEPYILEALGRSFVGYELIQTKVRKLSAVYSALKKQDKEIILLLAPGKGSYYPEYIPDRYNPEVKTTTNYEVYLKELSKTDIKVVDFKKWFEELKPNAKYPLFPNNGTHWSTYGETLAVDSLIKYIASLGYAQRNEFIIGDEIIISDTAIGRDNDIEEYLNLLIDLPSIKLAYPTYSFKALNPKGKVPEILVMGDSFYWDIFEKDIINQAFSSKYYWYYNYVIHSTVDRLRYRWETTYEEEIKNCDIILMVITDSNLKDFAFEFVDGMYDAFVK